MIEDRLIIASYCVRAVSELLQVDEVARLEIDLAEEGTIRFTIELKPLDEIVFEVYAESLDHPLEAAVAAYNYVQDYLMDYGPTQGQPRPQCQPGHVHPATCQHRDDTVVIVCPRDLTVVRRVI